MFNVGTFNRYLDISTPEKTKSSSGAPVRAYEHTLYLFAGRESAGSGQEQTINNRIVVPKQFNYFCNKEASINEGMRITDNSINYNILSVNNEDDMFLEILAEEDLS